MIKLAPGQRNLVNEFGNPLESERGDQGFFANQYDVVNRWTQTDQWAFANLRSGVATDDFNTRSRIMSAARFEYANNSYCRGICLKMAQEVVGTGPRLEIMPQSPTKRANRAATQVEKGWQEWADETGFVEKLITGILEEIVAGEIFHQFRTNRSLATVPVDFMSYEGIQIQSNGFRHAMPSDFGYGDSPEVDGLKLDEQGNIVGFYKLRSHPGGDGGGSDWNSDVDLIPADIMVQMFRQERPSQFRGVSWLTACIEMFGKLRRYTEACIETAENAASILGTIETAFQPNLCTPGDLRSNTIGFGSGTLMTLPSGWKYNAYRPEQPSTAYPDFKAEILHEIISCLLMPWNLASADSSEFNFASAQTDSRIFDRYVMSQRERQEKRFINRFLEFWFDYAVIAGFIPSGLGAFTHRWYWPPKSPIDPMKMANAAKTLKEAGLLDEQKYWQELGMSAKDAVDQRLRLQAYEIIRAKEIGEELGVKLKVNTAPAPAPAPPAPPKPEEATK